jgi:5-methylcytosine-specific restriction endonuclease McrA
MPYKAPGKEKEYQEKYRADNKEQIKEQRKKYYEQKKEKLKDYQKKRNEEQRQNAIESITTGGIIDRHKWDLWCDTLKRSAKQNKKSYSNDFTNDLMFEMMVQGCFYCGDVSTTIDRVDSKLEHSPDNCVASCWGCNNSKGTADPFTFVRKAYYRARGMYYDTDTDIWFIHKKKPSMSQYKHNANKKEVSFELTKGEFDTLIKKDCEYCKRSPSTWFGIDRVVPTQGYVLKNVVSCCFDCNLDKLEGDVMTMIERNRRVASRVDVGEFRIDECDKTFLHKGTCKTSKKACVRGIVYANMSVASRALGMSESYVKNCIRKKSNSEDIFEISDEFYNFSVENNLENITKKMYVLYQH